MFQTFDKILHRKKKKMKKKYHIVGTVLKSNRQIVERGIIDTANMYIFPGLIWAIQ
jgi:hypothetical protein